MQVQTIIENSVCELFLTFAREAESLISMYLEEGVNLNLPEE